MRSPIFVGLWDSGLKSDTDSLTHVIVTVYWVTDADRQILNIFKNNPIYVTYKWPCIRGLVYYENYPLFHYIL